MSIVTGPIMHYLIVFDHKTMKAEVLEFDLNVEAALASYAEKEREFIDDRTMEVVLVGSDSLDSVKATHSNYFPSKYLPDRDVWLPDVLALNDVASLSP